MASAPANGIHDGEPTSVVTTGDEQTCTQCSGRDAAEPTQFGRRLVKRHSPARQLGSAVRRGRDGPPVSGDGGGVGRPHLLIVGVVRLNVERESEKERRADSRL